MRKWLWLTSEKSGIYHCVCYCFRSDSVLIQPWWEHGQVLCVKCRYIGKIFFLKSNIPSLPAPSPALTSLSYWYLDSLCSFSFLFVLSSVHLEAVFLLVSWVCRHTFWFQHSLVFMTHHCFWTNSTSLKHVCLSVMRYQLWVFDQNWALK